MKNFIRAVLKYGDLKACLKSLVLAWVSLGGDGEGNTLSNVPPLFTFLDEKKNDHSPPTVPECKPHA